MKRIAIGAVFLSVLTSTALAQGPGDVLWRPGGPHYQDGGPGRPRGGGGPGDRQWPGGTATIPYGYNISPETIIEHARTHRGIQVAVDEMLRRGFTNPQYVVNQNLLTDLYLTVTFDKPGVDPQAEQPYIVYIQMPIGEHGGLELAQLWAGTIRRDGDWFTAPTDGLNQPFTMSGTLEGSVGTFSTSWYHAGYDLNDHGGGLWAYNLEMGVNEFAIDVLMEAMPAGVAGAVTGACMGTGALPGFGIGACAGAAAGATKFFLKRFTGDEPLPEPAFATPTNIERGSWGAIKRQYHR